MAEKHICNKAAEIATLQEQILSLKELSNKDIQNMQKQLNELSDNFKTFLKEFGDFTKEMRAGFVSAKEFTEAQDKIRELEKFREWLLVKIAFISGIVTVAVYIVTNFFNANK